MNHGKIRERSKFKKIRAALLIITALCVCGYIAVSVVGRNYRRYDGTYVSHTNNTFVTGSYSRHTYEHVDIVDITRQDGGYGIRYISSGNSDYGYYYEPWISTSPTADSDDEWSMKESLLTSDDSYVEYSGFMSEKIAREGGIVECYEQVSGRKVELLVYFTRNGICVSERFNYYYLRKSATGTPYYSSSGTLPDGMRPETGEYSLLDMYGEPMGDRLFYASPLSCRICERRGYDVYAVLELAGGIMVTAAALCGTAAVVLSGIKGRRAFAAVGLALSAAAFAASVILPPGECVAGGYVQTDAPEDILRGLAYTDESMLEYLSDYGYSDIYANVEIASVGGKYIVMVWKGRTCEYMCVSDMDRKGRLALEEEILGGTPVEIELEIVPDPLGRGITLNAEGGTVSQRYEFERVDGQAFNMLVKYIILLPLSASFVVLLVVSARRRRAAQANPEIPYGRYEVSDMVYINPDLEYMRDYMLKNWRELPVELGADSLSVGTESSGLTEYKPARGEKLTALSGAAGMKRCLCVEPVLSGNGGDVAGGGAGNNSARYHVLFNKKRKVLAYSVGSCLIAAFRLGQPV